MHHSGSTVVAALSLLSEFYAARDAFAPDHVKWSAAFVTDISLQLYVSPQYQYMTNHILKYQNGVSLLHFV